MSQLFSAEPTLGASEGAPRGKVEEVGPMGLVGRPVGRPASQWAHRPPLSIHRFLPEPTCQWHEVYLLSCRFLALVGPLLYILTHVAS